MTREGICLKDKKLQSPPAAAVGTSLDGELTKVAKGAGITFFGSVLGKGINYISRIIIARLLGAEFFGFYVIGFAIFGLAELLSRMGLHEGALRYVSIYMGEEDKKKVKGTITESIAFSFGIGVCIGLILFFGSNFIATNIFHKPDLSGILKLFSVGIPFMASMTVTAFATRGFQKMQYYVYTKNVFQPVANLLLIVLFYSIGFELYGAIGAQVISAGFGLCCAIYFIKQVFPEIKNIKTSLETAKLLRFSVPLLVSGFSGFLIMWTDTLMLGHFMPTDKVGIYQAAFQTSLLLNVVLMAFNSIFGPIIADMYNRQQTDKLNELFKIITKWTLYLTLPLFLMVLFLAKGVMYLFGPKFIIGWVPLVILASSQLVSASVGSVGQILTMSGHQKLWLYNTSTIAVLNVILNLLFIPLLGIVGAAVATATSVGILNLLSLLEVRLLIGISPFDKRHIKILIGGLSALAVCSFQSVIIRGYIPLYYNAIVVLLIVGGTFGLMLKLVKADKEDRLILNILRNKIKRCYEDKFNRI